LQRSTLTAHCNAARQVRGSRTSLHADDDEDGVHRPDLDFCIAPIKPKPAAAAPPRRAAR
jgi:hypothetical protein